MTAAAERQRRWRERAREGRLVVQIEVSPEVVDALVDAGRLGQWDERDRTAVGDAIAKLTDEWAQDIDAVDASTICDERL